MAKRWAVAALVSAVGVLLWAATLTPYVITTASAPEERRIGQQGRLEGEPSRPAKAASRERVLRFEASADGSPRSVLTSRQPSDRPRIQAPNVAHVVPANDAKPLAASAGGADVPAAELAAQVANLDRSFTPTRGQVLQQHLAIREARAVLADELSVFADTPEDTTLSSMSDIATMPEATVENVRLAPAP